VFSGSACGRSRSWHQCHPRHPGAVYIAPGGDLRAEILGSVVEGSVVAAVYP